MGKTVKKIFGIKDPKIPREDFAAAQEAKKAAEARESELQRRLSKRGRLGRAAQGRNLLISESETGTEQSTLG